MDPADRRRAFWLRAVDDVKLRGVQDILIAVVDGLKDFPETTVETASRRMRQRSNGSGWRCATSWRGEPVPGTIGSAA